MQVSFGDVMVLESRFGTSKGGNPYCVLRFLDGYRVYDCMQFGDSAGVAAGLVQGSHVSLGFELVPGREGGVRMELVSVGQPVES